MKVKVYGTTKLQLDMGLMTQPLIMGQTTLSPLLDKVQISSLCLLQQHLSAKPLENSICMVNLLL